ncbi:hypothetical protein DSO57_1019795 [Entomophthora muscae]|uniref:Uncharacterized protein n=1 Tax=Entomophthora muscae TaxID=34485 RepID=A0ACC2UQ45_9FUNG|nr:hypothetical protein DSO57_1019795 [Entomophthora muscae]
MKSTKKPAGLDNSSKFLENLTVTKADGKAVKLSSLWQERDVVLKVLPRLGCQMCKYEARSLGELRMLTDPDKVALAAVCFEGPDLPTFLSEGYWDWDIFVDDERKVYKEANLYRMSRWQLIKSFFTKRVQAMYRFTREEFGYTNSSRGDAYQLGGTFVIGQGGKLLFQFRPRQLAMFPSVKEIYKCLGGEPEEIDEPTPPEHIFSPETCQLTTNTPKHSISSFFCRQSFTPL